MDQLIFNEWSTLTPAEILWSSHGSKQYPRAAIEDKLRQNDGPSPSDWMYLQLS